MNTLPTIGKRCLRCERVTKSSGTHCKDCKREAFPGVDSLLGMMTRQRIPCACGQTASAVVDFRPVCLSCKATLRTGDCNHRKDWREWRGYCRECYEPAVAGHKHCAHHLAEGRRRAATSQQNNIFERRERMKAAAKARVLAGKCRSCSAPHLPNLTLCAACREKASIRARNKYFARTQSARTVAALECIYGHRADARDARGDFSLGMDFPTMASLSHAYGCR